MIDLSIPVVLGTVVAEVVVVIGSFSFSNYLNRGGQVKFGLNSGAKMAAQEWDDASKPQPKKISYKDEKESYFDHSATATQMKFELTQIMNESSDVTPTSTVKAHSKSS